MLYHMTHMAYMAQMAHMGRIMSVQYYMGDRAIWPWVHHTYGLGGASCFKEKHKPPQKLAREPRATEFALELRATGVEWGSLVACIVNLRT